MPASQADRNRAYQIRARIKKGEVVSDDDRDFESQYTRSAMQSAGASAAARTVHIEESQMAMGVGDGAAEAAAGALARQEGMRLDYATTNAISGMSRACEMFEKMCTILLKQNTQMGEVQMSMLNTMREQYIARTQAEVDLMLEQADRDAEDKPDPVLEQAMALLGPLLGGALGKQKT